MTPPLELNERELLAMAERCEAAAGPDRELDAEIVVALDLRPDWCRGYGELFIDPRRELDQPVIRVNSTGEKQSSGHPPIGDYPAYTASLDSAMTLVPEGWPSVQCGTTDDGRGYAALAGNDMHMFACDPDEFYVEGEAATMPLALTAAALRAIAAREAGR